MTWAVVCQSYDGQAQAFGPFRSYDKARALFDRIVDDGDSSDTHLILRLDRPDEEVVGPWASGESEEQ